MGYGYDFVQLDYYEEVDNGNKTSNESPTTSKNMKKYNQRQKRRKEFRLKHTKTFQNARKKHRIDQRRQRKHAKNVMKRRNDPFDGYNEYKKKDENKAQTVKLRKLQMNYHFDMGLFPSDQWSKSSSISSGTKVTK